MKKLVLVSVVALGLMSFTSNSENSKNIEIAPNCWAAADVIEEVGVGDCFNIRTQAMNDALSWGWPYWDAWDFASAVFNACVAQNE